MLLFPNCSITFLIATEYIQWSAAISICHKKFWQDKWEGSYYFTGKKIPQNKTHISEIARQPLQAQICSQLKWLDVASECLPRQCSSWTADNKIWSDRKFPRWVKCRWLHYRWGRHWSTSRHQTLFSSVCVHVCEYKWVKDRYQKECIVSTCKFGTEWDNDLISLSSCVGLYEDWNVDM